MRFTYSRCAGRAEGEPPCTGARKASTPATRTISDYDRTHGSRYIRRRRVQAEAKAAIRIIAQLAGSGTTFALSDEEPAAPPSAFETSGISNALPLPAAAIDSATTDWIPAIALAVASVSLITNARLMNTWKPLA